MKKRVNKIKTACIKVANCLINIEYNNKTKVIPFLKDFIVSSSKNYDYHIKLKNKTTSPYKNNTYRKVIVLPEEIRIGAFQYFVRNILQDFFGRKKNGFFLHCSGVHMNKGAYLFLGPQGAGKSTICKMLSNIAPVLADDSGIIVKENSNFYFYQTPFLEKKQFRKSIKRLAIRKIFFINKAKICSATKLNKEGVLDLFVKQIWTDRKRRLIQIKTLMQVVDSFDQFYQLDFTKNRKLVSDYFQL